MSLLNKTREAELAKRAARMAREGLSSRAIAAEFNRLKVRRNGMKKSDADKLVARGERELSKQEPSGEATA